jgi:Flp pilus assembly protein TadG
MSKRAKHSLGQSLVEFALILPALVLMIMGLFEFARMIQVWLTLQNCAQAAARYATTGQEHADPLVDKWDTARLATIKEEALNKAVTLNIQTGAGPSDLGYFQVNIYASDPPVLGTEYPGGPNARVAVDVIYNYPLITPIATFLSPYVKLTAHAEMINERFRFPGYGTPVGKLPPTIVPTPTPTITPTPTNTPLPTDTPTQTPMNTPTETPNP